VRTTARRRRDRKREGEEEAEEAGDPTVMRRRFFSLLALLPRGGGTPKCPAQAVRSGGGEPLGPAAAKLPPLLCFALRLVDCLGWVPRRRRWPMEEATHSTGEEGRGQNKERGTVKMLCLRKAAVRGSAEPHGRVHQPQVRL
jgi:hypothetical protein